MGRRRKRRKKQRPRGFRPPSRLFQCPVCGALTLTIDFKKADEPGWKIAVIKCSSCKLYCTMKVRSVLDRIDVYNRLVDMVYENRLDECRQEEPTVEEAPLEEEEAPVIEESPAGAEDVAQGA